MIEIFKTNVTEREHANMLIDQIHKSFTDHEANFDLHDHDKILRVKSRAGKIEPSSYVNFLKGFGVIAEVLPG